MEKVSFWSRVGQWLRNMNGASSRPGGAEGVDGGRATSPIKGVGGDRGDTGRSGLDGPFGRGARAVETDRAEREVVRADQLLESIRDLLERQDRRAEQAAVELSTAGEHVAGLSSAVREQANMLGEISLKLEAEATGRQTLAQGLAQLPRLADAQRETMVSIARQLEAGREAADRQSAVLGELRQALEVLGEATRASAAIVERLRAEAVERDRRADERLDLLIRRVSMLGAAATVLAAVGLVLGVVAVVR